MEGLFANEGVVEKAHGGGLRRLGAYILDCGVLLIGLMILQTILSVVNPLIPILRRGLQPTPTQLHLWVFATATIPFLLYFSLTLISSRQATLGMRMLKLKVADVSGGRVRFGQSLLRSAVLLIPLELNHAVMFYLAPRNAPPRPVFFIGIVAVWAMVAVYLAAMLLTRRRQSVHDLIAGTVVQRAV